MNPADEVQQVRDDVWFWQAYDPAVKVDLSSCAVKVPWTIVVIDPIAPGTTARKVVDCFDAKHLRGAVVLTNGNHTRATLEFAGRLDAEIYASAEAAAVIRIPGMTVVSDGEEIAPGLSVITLPGFGPGEIALHTGQNGGALFIGDALINFGPSGFAPLPAKYCENPKLGLESLRKLLRFDFQLLTFAHGLPIAANAKRRLELLLS